jgi:hypothetical protein
MHMKHMEYIVSYSISKYILFSPYSIFSFQSLLPCSVLSALLSCYLTCIFRITINLSKDAGPMKRDLIRWEPWRYFGRNMSTTKSGIYQIFLVDFLYGFTRYSAAQDSWPVAGVIKHYIFFADLMCYCLLCCTSISSLFSCLVTIF